MIGSCAHYRWNLFWWRTLCLRWRAMRSVTMFDFRHALHHWLLGDAIVSYHYLNPARKPRNQFSKSSLVAPTSWFQKRSMRVTDSFHTLKMWLWRGIPYRRNDEEYEGTAHSCELTAGSRVERVKIDRSHHTSRAGRDRSREDFLHSLII